jgi:hypothetical protein
MANSSAYGLGCRWEAIGSMRVKVTSGVIETWAHWEEENSRGVVREVTVRSVEPVDISSTKHNSMCEEKEILKHLSRYDCGRS